MLSPQMLINCRTNNFTCTDDSQVKMKDVLEQLKSVGVSEEGCNNYYANDELNCSKENRCKDCENGEDIHRTPVCKPKRF